MVDCKSVLTPIVKENSIKNSEQPVDKNLYLSMVGSLIYLAQISRPDIAFAVSQVSQAMANPIQENFIAVKRILRYISGTKNYSITYSKNGNKILHGYSDSDWGGDQINRRSTSGYIFCLAGAAISWLSKKQPTVALSSAEAEYMAAYNAAQEIIYLRMLLKDLKFIQYGSTILYMDNQSAIA